MVMPLANVMFHETIEKQDFPDDIPVFENAKCSNTFQRDLITTKTPTAVYNGGYDAERNRGVRLRFATGGAGQTGLIKAWADTFIQYMVEKRGEDPFEVAWFLGDTTESLTMLSTGAVDIALTYNPAAEKQLLHSGEATERHYAFRDHFLLTGPLSNPAGLKDEDDIFTMFNKIAIIGNADSIASSQTVCPPDLVIPPTRFLSRFDKSATNIKESQIFCTIGQVPWAHNYSKWYHQYPCFPLEALEAASLLSEYTLTDFGIWLSTPESVTSKLKIFRMGSDDADDPLLNPAHILRGKKAFVAHEDTCTEFLAWVIAADGGQKVIEGFCKNGKRLFSKAPLDGETKCGV